MNQQPIQVISSESSNIWSDILLSLKDRKGYKNNTQSVIIPTYFYKIIGVDNEDSYYNQIFDFDQKLIKVEHNYLKITDGFSFEYSNYVKKNFNSAWDKISFYNRKKPEFIISILKLENTLPSFPNPALSNRLEYALENIISIIINHYPDKDLNGLNDIIFRIICYCHEYIYDLFKDKFDYEKINPKILFYGDLLEEDVYFLILMHLMTVDIVFINSYSESAFADIKEHTNYTKTLEYNKRIHLKPFPISKVAAGSTTIALEASREINNMLFTEEGGFYKPWQFSDFLTERIPLKTTYDEVYILGKQQAMFRPNFKVEKFTVRIPSLFTKVAGVHEDIKKYWQDIHSLIEEPNTFLVKSFPMVKSFDEIANKAVSFEAAQYQTLLENNKISLDPQKLLSSQVWKYKHLRIGLQKLLAYRISDMCSELPMFEKNLHPFEIRIKIFAMLLGINTVILNILQKFDYPYNVPKIILYTENYTLKFAEIVFLNFLNSLGLDIIIYSPSGYSDIENCMIAGSYDLHRLKNFNMNLPYKPYKKSIFSNVFKFKK